MDNPYLDLIFEAFLYNFYVPELYRKQELILTGDYVPKYSPRQAEQLTMLAKRALGELTPINKEILKRRHGVGCKKHTFKEIARCVGLSESNVSKRHIRTLWFYLPRSTAGYEIRRMLARLGYGDPPDESNTPERIDDLKHRVKLGERLSDEVLRSVSAFRLSQLSGRTIFALRSNTTLLDLKQETRCSLLSQIGFGKKMLSELESALAEFGIVLQD